MGTDAAGDGDIRCVDHDRTVRCRYHRNELRPPGRKEMSEHVRTLSAGSPRPIFVMPNAGIPENIGGRAHYHLSPEDLVKFLSHFVKDLGVQIVGAAAERPRNIFASLSMRSGICPCVPQGRFCPECLKSLSIRPDACRSGTSLGRERTNANGSKMFKDCSQRRIGKESLRWGGSR